MNFIKNKFSKIFYYKSDNKEDYDISQNDLKDNKFIENKRNAILLVSSAIVRSSFSSILLLSSISITTISCLGAIMGGISTISCVTLSITAPVASKIVTVSKSSLAKIINYN